MAWSKHKLFRSSSFVTADVAFRCYMLIEKITTNVFERYEPRHVLPDVTGDGGEQDRQVQPKHLETEMVRGMYSIIVATKPS